MIDITHKSSTLREATAEATLLVSDPATIVAIENKQVPKGDVFEMAKTAGLFAVKRTSDMIPDCHPLPVEYTGVDYSIDGLEVRITMTVRTIYKTGVEVEAMHGVSVVALTMYDMLKPIDKGIEIHKIRLVSKKGGKSSYQNKFGTPPTVRVVVCNDRVHSGEKDDRAGQIVLKKVEALALEVKQYDIIPQEAEAIEAHVKALADNPCDILIYTGGTGLAERDILPETLRPLLERAAPGMEEAMRSYGQQRTPYAMIARSVAGVIGKTLVLAIPGSTNGAKESMDALFPAGLHSLKAISQKS